MLAILLLFFTLGAQQSKEEDVLIKWGKVDESLVGRTVYAKDTSAAAVVITDQTHIYYGKNFILIIEQHVTLQILNKEGYEWANVSIPFEESLYNKQRITEKKAQIYSKDATNKVLIKALKSKDFIVENAESSIIKNLKFTFPEVQPGDILEYSVKKEFLTDDILYTIPDHYAQWPIPVENSVLKVDIPSYFDYTVVPQTAFNYTISKKHLEDKYMQYVFGGRRFDEFMPTFIYTLVLNNLPALKSEPYIFSLNNFQQKVTFQLNQYGFNANRIAVSRTWKQVAADLLRDEYFGQKMKPSEADQNVKIFYSSDDPQIVKATAIYEYVQKKLTFNGVYSRYSFKGSKDLIRLKRGSGTGINLFLIALLREEGINAYPVLISTRSNGTVASVRPVVDQFNHTIVELNIEGKKHYLDASSKFAPFGMLKEESSVDFGLRIHEDGTPNWIELPSPETMSRKIVIDATLGENGILKGSFQLRSQGLYIIAARGYFAQADSVNEALKKAYFRNSPSVTIDDVTIEETDPSANEFKVRVLFTAKDQIVDAGDLKLFDPSFVSNFDNPFSSEKRQFPIEYDAPFSESILTTIRYPEKWVVESLPDDKSANAAQPMVFRRKVESQPGAVQVLTNFNSVKATYGVSDYPSIKKLWETRAATDSDVIAFKVKQ